MSDFRFDPFGPTYRLPRGFAHRPAHLAGLFADIFGLAAYWIARAARIRRDMRLLAEMDDRLLSDIGISRSQNAVREGRD